MIQRFELRRLSDGLVYRFTRLPEADPPAFRRADRDLRLTWRDGFGWGAWDGDDLQGRPWRVSFEQQSRDTPPQGRWVSHKGVKAYAYDLVYLDGTSKGDPHV